MKGERKKGFIMHFHPSRILKIYTWMICFMPSETSFRKYLVINTEKPKLGGGGYNKTQLLLLAVTPTELREARQDQEIS